MVMVPAVVFRSKASSTSYVAGTALDGSSGSSGVVRPHLPMGSALK